jgi:hypothetical protein
MSRPRNSFLPDSRQRMAFKDASIELDRRLRQT